MTDTATIRKAVEDGSRGLMSAERGQVAYDTAIALGYTWTEARQFQEAAEWATRMGWGMNRGAGRVKIGVLTSGLGGQTHSLSVVTPSGGYYDPTKPSDPGNDLSGSD